MKLHRKFVDCKKNNMTFTYEKAKTLPEAIALFAANSGRFPVLAGGTDIIVQMRSGLISPKGLVDISALDELKKIGEIENCIEIGACATHASIANSELVREYLPVLSEACSTVGATQIQNRGTIGGNIMNASPAGDTLTVIMALCADLLVQSVSGERWVSAEKFFTGYRKTAVGTGELLTKIRFPKMHKEDVARFYKIGTRKAQAISKVVMCVRARVNYGGIENIAIAIGSVAPTTVRLPGTEALLCGKAINAALIDKARHSIEDEVHPIDDVRSTAAYRRFVCSSLLVKFLKEVTSKKK